MTQVFNVEQRPLNQNAQFQQQIVDGKLVYVPNDNYRRIETEKVNRHLSFMVRCYFFKYMLENIQESQLIPLRETREKTKNQYNNWNNSINQHIARQEGLLQQNEIQLRNWNGSMQASITRKEVQAQAAKKLQANADPQALEDQYERLKQVILEITETDARLKSTKANGKEVLAALKDFKIILATVFRQTIQKYEEELEAINEKNDGFVNSLHQIFTYSRDLMQNQNYDKQTKILQKQAESLNHFLQEVNTLFLKFYKLLQELDLQSRMVGIKKEQSETTVNYEVGKCRLKFLEAEIQYRETKKRKLLIVLHGLIARDAVTTLKTTNAQADENFDIVRKKQPYQERRGGAVTNYTYQLTSLNPGNVVYSSDTQAKVELVQRYNFEIEERSIQRNLIIGYEQKLKELIQRSGSLKNQNQMSYQQVMNTGQLTREKQFQYYQITLMEYSSYHIERQSIQALLGCMSKNIAFKKVGCCSCYSCCPSCYSKPIHTYNDLYYEDYERIFIKAYRYHHQVQSSITINEIKEFKLANLADFLMDYEIVGSYRNDQGFRQEVRNNFRASEYSRALHFTIANIANLFALQEIVKLQINEQKHRAIITKEFTSVLFTIKAGDLSIPKITYPIK